MLYLDSHVKWTNKGSLIGGIRAGAISFNPYIHQ
ncbi:MAG: hypothetical protein GW893_05865 [Armatimonadetes bacterium]|nr:hypothetical protein [Armatimonadota bacterium]PIU64248.1 MAG: hypothetical protein COS85_13320 [Armatimonadetes bacterium CG07_land_8_20_14_0_80_59_28]PIX38201.1 MAG: hypothetical protein COZ56_21060 [Armatimonadetes bacterium CG_4_8_14_3_um_filter_58_9]PIY43910.1 MAG: hypothetical protein COZ05_09695 [Armatimonadetes bacterium CG_4_10_14_3_um_filter_59_10]PJB68891.1 MAG: hypothetical protein CO095_10565 [Armatimonadetes bacterium CG_4_9_14_3_um_filter_58_7]